MKELSIEEKAKRYDKAIKKAKSKIKNDKDHVLYEDDVIDIFPELKESENERIRKAIYNAIKYLETELSWDFLGDVDILDAYAWLEKQGQTFTKKDVDDAYLEGMCVAKHELEKQGEQKPAEWNCTDKGDHLACDYPSACFQGNGKGDYDKVGYKPKKTEI